MADQPYSSTPTRSRFLQPTTLLVFVILVSSVVVWLSTIDWSQIDNTESRFTPAVVTVAPADEARLIREHSPVFGPSNAGLTIVEFSDFECPFCAEAFPVVRELLSKYGDRVQFVYRHFPVESIHPDAYSSAVAAQCAHAQGKFMAYHDRLFLNQESLGSEALQQYAVQAGIEPRAFATCLTNATAGSEVATDLADGVALGVRATPTWFINGRKVEGAIPKDLFFEVVDAVLAQSVGGK